MRPDGWKAALHTTEPFWAHKNAKNLLVAWGSLQRSPRPPSWWGGAPRGLCCPLPKNPTYNIDIVLVLCVCTHVYENALLFSRSCTWGGLQLSSAGTDLNDLVVGNVWLSLYERMDLTECRLSWEFLFNTTTRHQSYLLPYKNYHYSL